MKQGTLIQCHLQLFRPLDVDGEWVNGQLIHNLRGHLWWAWVVFQHPDNLIVTNVKVLVSTDEIPDEDCTTLADIIACKKEIEKELRRREEPKP